eukprot:8791009-Ditylum_brightwellii.AAC.1
MATRMRLIMVQPTPELPPKCTHLLGPSLRKLTQRTSTSTYTNTMASNDIHQQHTQKKLRLRNSWKHAFLMKKPRQPVQLHRQQSLTRSEHHNTLRITLMPIRPQTHTTHQTINSCKQIRNQRQSKQSHNTLGNKQQQVSTTMTSKTTASKVPWNAAMRHSQWALQH